jgi:hypothetical protein
MLGRDDEYVAGLERAHRAYLEAGDVPRAVRCALWIGNNFLFHGETGPARGWFARRQRLLERDARDCVERGYLLLATLLEQVFADDHEAAADLPGISLAVSHASDEDVDAYLADLGIDPDGNGEG